MRNVKFKSIDFKISRHTLVRNRVNLDCYVLLLESRPQDRMLVKAVAVPDSLSVHQNRIDQVDIRVGVEPVGFAGVKEKSSVLGNFLQLSYVGVQGFSNIFLANQVEAHQKVRIPFLQLYEALHLGIHRGLIGVSSDCHYDFDTDEEWMSLLEVVDDFD